MAFYLCSIKYLLCPFYARHSSGCWEYRWPRQAGPDHIDLVFQFACCVRVCMSARQLSQWRRKMNKIISGKCSSAVKNIKQGEMAGSVGPIRLTLGRWLLIWDLTGNGKPLFFPYFCLPHSLWPCWPLCSSLNMPGSFLLQGPPAPSRKLS